jgi:hypothetical protein
MNFSPLRDYLDLPSSIPYSHYRAYLAQRRIRPRASAYEKFKSLLDAEFVISGFRLAEVVVKRRCRFQDYNYAAGESGIFALESGSPGDGGLPALPDARVSLAGDWGTGTDEAVSVARGILAFRPHFTIHLGDVYYVGDGSEIDSRCMDMPAESIPYAPAAWPRGSLGSFALNGDRQMHANGNGYFQKFLPTLGTSGSQGQINKRQAASFFCLRNEHWMLIAIDTGYNSAGYSSMFSKCKLENALLVWLEDYVRPREFRGAAIIIGHHPYFSAFDRGYDRPATQLKKIFGDRCVLWFWAHEHRLAIYGSYKSKDGIPAFGRCVGHGGIPVSLGSPNPKTTAPLVVYDNRTYDNIDGTFVGFNGFANLTFVGNKLTVEFISLSRPLERGYSLLVRESWESKNGIPQGAGISMFESELTLVNPDLCAAQR